MVYTRSELIEAITILKRIYLLAIIPNTDGQDHINIQNYLRKLEDHINSLPADGDPPAAPPDPATPPVDPAPAG